MILLVKYFSRFFDDNFTFFFVFFRFTSARIRNVEVLNSCEKKNFIPPLFMFFLDVFEVFEAIKNLVSVCLGVCVCLCVCLCVCHHDYSSFLLYYRGRDGAKIFVILLWWTDKLLRCHAWQFRDVRDKNVTFLGIFWIFFNFFDIFVDYWAHIYCSWRQCTSSDIPHV
jgi:hypothetical protein